MDDEGTDKYCAAVEIGNVAKNEVALGVLHDQLKNCLGLRQSDYSVLSSSVIRDSIRFVKFNSDEAYSLFKLKYMFEGDA